MLAMTTTTGLAVRPQRLRTNAWGRYYVSAECTGCGLCASYAPANFASTFDGRCYAVLHQPVEAEEEDVRMALQLCPFRCIHDDGDVD